MLQAALAATGRADGDQEAGQGGAHQASDQGGLGPVPGEWPHRAPGDIRHPPVCPVQRGQDTLRHVRQS